MASMRATRSIATGDVPSRSDSVSSSTSSTSKADPVVAAGRSELDLDVPSGHDVALATESRFHGHAPEASCQQHIPEGGIATPNHVTEHRAL